MKKLIFFLTILIVLAAPVTSVSAKPKQVVTDAYSLIAEVNALRASYGLAAYDVSSILMGTAQQHAEFMSVNGVSHIGYGGTRPYQRVLNAGYALAGDLSLGGFMSENIIAGGDKSVQDAVREWQGDQPHWNTMMSTDLTEIGAGVAIVDGYVYYVIDCARPLGAKAPTAAPGETQQPAVAIGPPLARTVVPSTPNAEGKLVHVVGPGETLWLIAVTYKVTVLEIRELNYMSDTDAIYPGEKLLIAKDLTPGPIVAETPTSSSSSSPLEMVTDTPDLPTATGTATFAPFYTRTPLPTLSLPTDLAPVSAPAAPQSLDLSMVIVGAIVFAALVLAGVLVYAGRRGN
jgi:LysM repeat protein